VTDLGIATASWRLQPLVVVPLLVALLLYLIGVFRLSDRLASGRRVRRSELGAFFVGWMILAVALVSPLAVVSDVLLSAHMTQHELLILIAAPLLAMGRPVVFWLWALPERARRRVTRASSGVGIVTFLTAPLVAWLAHAITLWVWHIPTWYEAAVRDDVVHAGQHLSLTVTACLFWWGLVRGRYGRAGYGAALLYVFATGLHSGGLGALMTLSSRPWYELYVERAGDPAIALTDQQLAGLLMWIPGGITLLIVALAFFAAWLGDSRRHRQLAPHPIESRSRA
jgi:putative membrane protein